MTGQELLDELDIPVGQYRLSVKFPDDSERVGVVEKLFRRYDGVSIYPERPRRRRRNGVSVLLCTQSYG